MYIPAVLEQPGSNWALGTYDLSQQVSRRETRLRGAQRPTEIASAIPLYADIAGIHDYIVQAPGAFDKTVEGLYNAAEAGLVVEIRVVLHKQSVPRLVQLAEFIYRNFPFAAHIAFMGMEHMGYVKKNWDLLWMDPVDYMPVLERAVTFLWQRRMNVSICRVAHPGLYPDKIFAKQFLLRWVVGLCSA